MTHLVNRPVPARAAWQLEQQGLHPLLARLYAARGITDKSELDYDLKALLPPAALTHADDAARLLADAIEAEARLLIIGDYDCDGATATALGMRALKALGADVDFLLPDRFKLGYGLSPEIVDLAAEHSPDLIITVDNGIASIEGVERARQHSIATLITDHHLPAATLPAADCIVNPNQPGCAFASKNIAGVGVMFYVLLALRAELRERGHFAERTEPNFASLLDLVALGTVADVVKLDHNNRILVSQGLKRMRAGHLQPGLAALFKAAGRDPAKATAMDLGFILGPRLNAAGRLADMRLGVECLLTDDPVRALQIAQQLDQLNRERREIEADMQEQALHLLEKLETSADDSAPGIALFDASWHEGVVGILAARIKDRLHRPVFAFAPGENGIVKGSGRSIPGLHLRDALDLLAKRAPGLLLRFGGHAMAAGATLRAEDFPRFAALFAEIAGELVDPAALTRTLDTDGALEGGYYALEIARLLENEIWGQGFPAPLFLDEFAVEQQRVLKEKHLKLRLRKDGARVEAIQFNFTRQPGPTARLAFRLAINEYMGVETPQLFVEYLE
ncbi:MAG: single-stranded-DNA-specific exonuclease RecJ [Betaproteobacteria bacterium]|nr:single-stranded-DNA-specific exonuclease RecJ [Betaproteobacteria bacterium]MCL2885911.1 single-stranded-DNA-specific exonuclease RecJ [Betaproteobacteria bacterium]